MAFSIRNGARRIGASAGDNSSLNVRRYDHRMDDTTSDRLAALQARRRQQSADGQDRLAPSPEHRGVPDISWWRNPTMWLAITALAGWALGWIGYLSGALPWWAALLVNATANYLGFTVFHESVHRAAHTNRTFNDALGWFPALMLGFTFPVFRICHLNHHAHTNDPGRDPDHWVSHRPRALLPLWLISTAFNYRRLCFRHKWGSDRDRLGQRILDLTILGTAALTIATGHFAAFGVLYLLPILLAGLWLFYAFDYLPHFPFDSTERFHDTRIQPGRIRHALLLGQNYHLIHHLWVSVPWFSYRAVFEELEPQLRERDIRIG